MDSLGCCTCDGAFVVELIASLDLLSDILVIIQVAGEYPGAEDYGTLFHTGVGFWAIHGYIRLIHEGMAISKKPTGGKSQLSRLAYGSLGLVWALVGSFVLLESCFASFYCHWILFWD
ncbi:expressed unknown protein [Seminavis robusta]|uniref:Uncharacterized protein n=1 Tax=Seminavis robusta TaxID=568900 RepID=A0A9N8EQY0_9STRA|nr:expressed unknown protein [Seminavis robusta]|eukprot:Sro1706_g292520.1 n/a (118) ;mRNA; f:11837-12190